MQTFGALHSECLLYVDDTSLSVAHTGENNAVFSDSKDTLLKRSYGSIISIKSAVRWRAELPPAYGDRGEEDFR